MKRALLTTAATIAIMIGAGARHTADAQFAVIDAAQVAISQSAWYQQAADMGRQLASAAQQVELARARVAQAEAAYYAISHVTDLSSAVGALGMIGIRNPLPINPYALQSLLNGTGGVSGGARSLGALYTGARTANRVYEPPDLMGWAAQQINRTANSIAGHQSVALQLHQSAAERAQLIEALQARIASGVSPAERESLTNRLLAEQTYVQNQGVQASALATQATLIGMNQEQQRTERLQGSIEEVLGEARARGYWTGN